LRELATDFGRDRPCRDVPVAIDQEQRGRADARPVLRHHGVEGNAVARGYQLPERGVAGEQAGSFDEALRIGFEHALERARAGHDFGADRLVDGRGRVDVYEREVRRARDQHQQHERHQKARLEPVQGQIGEAHGGAAG
jgi:hypothetical protein